MVAALSISPAPPRMKSVTTSRTPPAGANARRADLLALDRQVCFALAVASRNVIGLYRPLLEPMGLTHPQYLVMLALWEEAPLKVSELGPPAQPRAGHPLAAAQAPRGERPRPARPGPPRRPRPGRVAHAARHAAAGHGPSGSPRPSSTGSAWTWPTSRSCATASPASSTPRATDGRPDGRPSAPTATTFPQHGRCAAKRLLWRPFCRATAVVAKGCPAHGVARCGQNASGTRETLAPWTPPTRPRGPC